MQAKLAAALVTAAIALVVWWLADIDLRLAAAAVAAGMAAAIYGIEVER